MASSVSVEIRRPTLRQSFEGAQGFSSNFKVVRESSSKDHGKPAEFLRYPSRLHLLRSSSADSEDSTSSRSSYSSDGDAGDRFSSKKTTVSGRLIPLKNRSLSIADKATSRRVSETSNLSVKGNSFGESGSGKLPVTTTLQRSGASSLRPSPFSTRTNSTASSGNHSMNGTMLALSRLNSSVESLDGLNLPSLSRDVSILERAQPVNIPLPAQASIHRMQVQVSEANLGVASSVAPSRRPSQFGGNRALSTIGRQNTSTTIMRAASILTNGTNTSATVPVGNAGGFGGGAEAALKLRASLKPINRDPERLEAAGVHKDDVEELQLLIDLQCLRLGPNHTRPTMASIMGAATVQKKDLR